MRSALIVSGALFFCGGMLLAQALFNKPVKVLGDPDFIGSAANPLAYDTSGPNWIEGQELNAPSGIALDTSVSPPILYIADTGNNRVLGFRYATQIVAGSVADLVIGQIDLYANAAQNPASGGRQAGLNGPTGLAVDSAGNLYVADTGNNRVLRFSQPFSAAGGNQIPSIVIGQKTAATSSANLNGIGASTLSLSGTGHTGIAIDPSGNLWVSDTGNNRVLRFSAAALATGTNFPAADTVLGQAGFTTSAGLPLFSAQRSVLTGLAGPGGLAFDGSGNLYVTDELYRVVVYNAPLTTNMSAATVLGVDPNAGSAASATQIELNAPGAVVVPGGTSPIVADTGNNRLLAYAPQTNWPLASSPSATAVTGQTSYTLNQANQGNPEPSAATLSAPVDLAATATELYVVDKGNNRVLVYASAASGYGAMASRVIGQLDFPYSGANLVDGKGFSFPNQYPAQAVLDTSVSPPHLYVADTLNNRVLGFKDFMSLQDGQPADLVIGQPDMYRTLANYPSGNTTTPNSSGLSLPTSLAVDSAGNLYVTDTGNSRTLRFPAPFGSGATSLEAADLVLGQESFTTDITDATPYLTNTPVGIALTPNGANTSLPNSGGLLVADSAQNRVLYFQKPFVSGMSASLVLGQSTFSGSTAASTPGGLNSPRGVAVDSEDHVLVADNANGRVQIYDRVENLSNGATPLVSLPGFSSPLGVAVGPANDFWVDNYAAGNLMHYPSVDNLPQTNDSSDATLPALGPHSAFVDPFNNLLVTDSINRVLYFAPQISYQNAANYSSRPLAAGTIAAIYPTVTANSIAGGSGTAPANQFPLPIDLSDTQVTVNGTPAPLYFVSSGQDNIILPQALGTSGTADLRVTRPSTGQILGAAELQLQAASPGLFTLDASGSGQLLAVNVQDGSVNSATHPVVRGQFVILYGTGVGPVANPPGDGAAATGQSASDFPQVLIASSGSTTGASGTTPLSAFIPASVTYSGLAPGFAGLWQINVQIPNDAQSGSAVVVRVYEKDIPNLDQGSSLTTTLAVN